MAGLQNVVSTMQSFAFALTQGQLHLRVQMHMHRQQMSHGVPCSLCAAIFVFHSCVTLFSVRLSSKDFGLLTAFSVD